MNKKLIIIAVIVVLLISVIGIAVFSLEDEEPEFEFEPESIPEPEPEPEPEQAVSELETPASTFAPAPQAEAKQAAVPAPAAVAVPAPAAVAAPAPAPAASTSNVRGDVYAVNSANQIYRKDSQGSAGSWRQPHPGAHLSNVSATGKTNIWGVQSGGYIYRCKRPCTTGQWIRVPGNLKQISADDQYVYGVNNNDNIYRMNEDGTGAWVSIPGVLKNITASGKDYIWGVNNNDNIYRCRKPCTSGKWINVPGKLKQVAADDKHVWGVNNANQIWKRPVDGSGSWTEAEASKRGGRLTWVSPSAPNYVWGVGTNKKLYYCKKPCTTASWSTKDAFNNAIQVAGDNSK